MTADYSNIKLTLVWLYWPNRFNISLSTCPIDRKNASFGWLILWKFDEVLSTVNTSFYSADAAYIKITINIQMGSLMVGCVLLTSSPECVALSRCAIPVTHVIVSKIVMILSSFQHVHIGINWHGNDSRLFQYKTDIGLALLTEPVQHFLVYLSNRSKECVFWMVNLVEIRRSLIYSKYFVLFSGCGVYKNHY